MFGKKSFNTQYAIRNTHNEKAFTLIEALFVVALIAILLAAIYPYLRATHRSWQSTDRRSEAIQNARVALDKMVRELRQASEFSQAQSSRVTFTDIDSNSITYQLTGDNLKRNNDILAGPVDSLAFTYYDASGNELSQPVTESDVRSVKISLAVEYLAGMDPLSFISLAFMRSAAGSAEGYIFSKNPSFSPSCSTFSTTDTFYIMVWTDEVDYTALDYAACELKKGGTKVEFNLTNNGDGTYTGSQSLAGFAAGTWTVNIDVKDTNTPAGSYMPTPAPNIIIV